MRGLFSSILGAIPKVIMVCKVACLYCSWESAHTGEHEVSVLHYPSVWIHAQ